MQCAVRRQMTPQYLDLQLRQSDDAEQQLTRKCCKMLLPNVHCVQKKKHTYLFDYNSGICWSIFVIFIPMETGINTLAEHIFYNLMTS